MLLLFDLVARVEEVAEEEEHRRRGPRGHEDLVRRDADAVRRRVVRGDRLAQGEDAEAVRVARAAVLDRLLDRLTDHRRRLEVRLAELEVHDVHARALECLRPFSDRKSTRLNSSHGYISYAVFCLKKKKQ